MKPTHLFLILFFLLMAFALVVPHNPTSLAQDDNGNRSPVQDGAAWPLFRYDHRNTGNSGAVAVYAGDTPWTVETGKGIFSTPVIDAAGHIYVGSADHVFYALSPSGEIVWQYETGEIIDSAAALPELGLVAAEPAILVPSGDGFLYNLRTAPALSAEERLIWKFDSRVVPRDESYNNWFEGNVALGFDGTIYAGNTNFNYYAINPDGTLQWAYETGGNNWSMAAFAEDGTIFWGSNDTYAFAVSPDGQKVWQLRTLGFIAASAAIGTDGTVYIGSFDSFLYALNPTDGSTVWRFKTDDHIYASVALGHDENGNTNRIYVGSADGKFYALDTAGNLLWSYDVLVPIRSSAAVGKSPDGADIIYFGAGDGNLYALNADGTRRWSYNTTVDTAELRDRNDLNASVALSETGVVIGGEHGNIVYVPYEYCLNADDARCNTNPIPNLPITTTEMIYITPGGSLYLEEAPPVLATGTMLTFRLLVREEGVTRDYYLCNAAACPPDSLRVTITPEVPLDIQKSADSVYLHIRPSALLQTDTLYTLQIAGDYYGNGRATGNRTTGGAKLGSFDSAFAFRTPPADTAVQLRVGADAVAAFEWTRLAVPIPPMMPSLNQIGFDYIDWLVGTVWLGEADANGAQPVVLWAIGARRDEAGVLVAEPVTDFTLPLSGVIQDGAFILQNRDFNMPVTGIPIPFDLFEIRGQFNPDFTIENATVYAETDAGGIPTFGTLLTIAGLTNAQNKLIVAGTYLTRPYATDSLANRPPEGVRLESLTITPATATDAGEIVATLALADGARYPIDGHRGGIVLIDPTEGRALSLDYHNNLSMAADAAGNLQTIRLTLPSGVVLPDGVQAVVLLDVFPLAAE